MPEQTTTDLISKVLAELEQIIEHLELDDDLIAAAIQYESEMNRILVSQLCYIPQILTSQNHRQNLEFFPDE